MEEVSFFVTGVPAPQGSKTRTKFGIREDNPKTRPWREAVAWTAAEARPQPSPNWLQSGPVAVYLRFTFPRPKSHYRTGRNAHLLKDSAPSLHTNKPDIDKLARAICDSCTGVLYRDDSQIAILRASKVWANPEAVPGVEVRLVPADGLLGAL